MPSKMLFAVAMVSALIFSGVGLDPSASSAAGSPESNLPDDFAVADASALSSTDSWVVGYSAQTGARIEHWDGGSWTAQVLPPLHSLTVGNVEAIAADDVWALGSSADARGRQFLHWDGVVWRGVRSPTFGGRRVTLEALSAVETDDVWAVGRRKRRTSGTHSVAEHWNGRRWSSVPVPRTRPDIRTEYERVAAASADDVWVFGFTYNVAEFEGHHFVTHWDGVSWTRSHGVVNPDTISGITAIGPHDVWIASGDDSGNLLQHWDGVAWSLVDTPAPGLASVVHRIEGSSSSDVWAVGGSKLDEHPETWEPMILHWDGSTWTQFEVSGERGHEDILSVAMAGASDAAWAFGWTGTHQIVRHWDGESWS